MKNILLFIAVAITIASCNNGAQEQAATQARQLDSIKNEMARRQLVDSINAVNAAAAAQPAASPVEQPAAAPAHHSSHSTPHQTYVTNNYSTTNAATAPAPAPEKKRKGIGATAAGAIIGAGVGGITGAMVDKKKGEGAVVGGVLGAGAGAGVGAIINKKQKERDQQSER